MWGIQVAKGKNQLAELDDKILYLLSTATGSLLDDDELVMTLQSSKKISNEVKEQLKVAGVVVKRSRDVAVRPAEHTPGTSK